MAYGEGHRLVYDAVSGWIIDRSDRPVAGLGAVFGAGRVRGYLAAHAERKRALWTRGDDRALAGVRRWLLHFAACILLSAWRQVTARTK